MSEYEKELVAHVQDRDRKINLLTAELEAVKKELNQATEDCTKLLSINVELQAKLELTVKGLEKIKKHLQPCLKEPERSAFWEAFSTLQKIGSGKNV